MRFQVHFTEEERLGMSFKEQYVLAQTQAHKDLQGRSEPNQHPIAAITDLPAALDEATGETMTNEELQAMFDQIFLTTRRKTNGK